MAPIVLTAEQKADALGRAEAEMSFAFERCDVTSDVLAAFIHVGIDNMTKFAGIAKDVDDFKQLLKDEFGLDATASLQERVKVTNVVICFETAKTRVAERNKLEGEFMAKHLIKPLTISEHSSMRAAWEKRFWAIEEEWVPARTYLEKRLEEMEQGELKAEPLTSVIAKDQEDPDTLVPVWTSSGALQMKKSSQQAEEPKNPEQLRRRIKLLGVGLMMLGLRHTTKQYLQNLNPQVFEDYLTYLLSDHCFYMQGKSAEGFVVSGPSWQQLLIYEFQVRRRAWLDVQAKGIEFGIALREAWKDPSTRERYLITPIALAAAAVKRPYEGKASSSQDKFRRDSGKKGGRKGGKGSGKGSKGNGKSGKGGGVPNCASRTPDGKAICYGYNNFDVRCRDSKCRFLHVCGGCFGKHPVYACRPGNHAETQGAPQA